MSWWQDKTHPIWRIAERVVLVAGIAFVCAYVGADNLDAKDVLSHVVNGAAIYGAASRFKGGQ